MREILCRGKDAESGKWLYGWVFGEKNKSIIELDTEYIGVEGVEAYVTSVIDPETVGQDTGLKDKNGQRIFEGDVVKGRYSLGLDSPRVIGVVEYVTAGFVVKGVKQYSGLQKELNRNFEVIGSKHDNPEMVEERP